MQLDRSRFVRVAGAASLAPLLYAARATAQTTQTLRIITIRTDAVKTLLWAQQQNLFGAHGLAIDLVNTSSSAASLTARKIIGVDSIKDLYTLATRGWVDNGGGASLKSQARQAPAARAGTALLSRAPELPSSSARLISRTNIG